MNIDQLLSEAGGAQPSFLDMTIDSLMRTLNQLDLAVPEWAKDAHGDQWVRLYHDGKHEFLRPIKPIADE